MISNTIILYILISFVIAFLAYLIGSNKSASREKIRTEQHLNEQSTRYRHQKDTFEKEIEILQKQSKKYLNFFVNIPEAVKNINSHLSFDDLITSIIRLIKVLIHTNEIEIYMFGKNTDSLNLIAALGTNRGKSIKVKLGEGVVGGAAETRMTFTREQIKTNSKVFDTEKLTMATPIIFRKEIFGVIGIGEITSKTEDEKTYLALIADLSAIAFKNHEYMDAIKEAAIKDSLTGLYNRRYFFEVGQEVLERSTNYNHVFSIFIFDIDNFKHYNDTNGHVQGDVLLKELSSLIKEKTRSPNIIARYGGEEFIILYQNCDKLDAAIAAENIRKEIASHPFLHGDKQPLGFVSISGGTATFPYDGNEINVLIELADKALYQSKKSGKNRVIDYRSAEFSSDQPAINPSNS